MGRMVHGTNGLHVVRKVRGTNSQWYKNYSNLFVFRTFNLSTSGLKLNVKILYYAKIAANVSS